MQVKIINPLTEEEYIVGHITGQLFSKLAYEADLSEDRNSFGIPNKAFDIMYANGVRLIVLTESAMDGGQRWSTLATWLIDGIVDESNGMRYLDKKKMKFKREEVDKFYESNK